MLPKGKVSLLDFDLTYLQYNGLDEVMRIWFFFDNIHVGQTPLKLYMDNVAVERRQEDFTIGLPVAGADNRITGFESKLEAQMMAVISYGVAYDQVPQPEWNTDKAYVSEGDASLKITLAKSNNYCRCAGSAWSGSCSLIMPGANYFNGFNLNEMLQRTGKTAEEYEVVVDLYNPGSQRFAVTLMAGERWLEPQTWTVVRAPLTSFNFATSGTFNITFGFVEFRDTADRTFYVDNFRIEEVAQ